jgi:predicted DNA-binding transcriptional regulator AlpA
MSLRNLSDIRPMPRRGLSRNEAAMYVGIGPTKFEEMVRDGRMPKPFRIDGRVIWDIHDIDSAINSLKETSAANLWDRVT